MESNNFEVKDDFNLNDLSFSNVIDGLNKYFAEDENQRFLRPFIEVKSNKVIFYRYQRFLRPFIEVKSNKVIFYRFNAEMYLDKLISWLRTKHGIFYYPGMEAKYAKAEKTIPPFSERMKNDGALNTLKKLHKLVTGDEVSDKADSPTLIAAAIETDFAVLKQDLKKHKTEIKEVSLETLRNMTNEEYSRWARAEYAESLSRNTNRSDINKLISDYCAKNDIIAPSPYFSDKACVEYLFSVVDLERDHRTAFGKQMVENYKLSLKNYILTDIQESIYCYHGLETKTVEELITWLIKMARPPRTSEFESFIRDLKEL